MIFVSNVSMLYMKKIIKQQKGNNDIFYCTLCPSQPSFNRKNIERHLLTCESHNINIVKKEDLEGHEELRIKIKEKTQPIK